MKSYPYFFFAGSILFLFFFPARAQESTLDLYYSGNYDQVIQITTETIAEGDTSFNSFYLKALSEVQLGRIENSITTLLHARELFPGDPRISRMLAVQYYEAGAYVEAGEYYSGIVTADSGDLSAWLKLAEIASFKQQYSEAIPMLEYILEKDSSNLAGLLMMGDILNRENNSAAVIYYEKAWAIYPSNQKVAYALGNWYIKDSMPDKAIPVCEQVLATDSSNIRFQKLMGFAFYKSGDPLPSIVHFQNALALGDSSAFTFKYLGISQYLAIQFEEATETLQTGAEKDSMDAEIRFFLGASLANTSRKADAMFQLDQSLKLMQPDPSVISRIYSEQGNIMRLDMEYERAYELYELAWEADTTIPISLYYMASILDNSLHLSKESLIYYQKFIDRLDHLPESENRIQQMPSIRAIVEDRIEMLREELFFLDQDQ